MRKILFISYGGGHANMLIPVFDRMHLNPQLDPQYLALTGAQIQLAEMKKPYLTYKDFIKSKDFSLVEQYGTPFYNNLKNKTFLPKEQTVAYMGMNYLELVNKYGEEKTHVIFKEKQRRSFFPYEFMTSILLETKPDLVVSTNSPRSEKACLLACRDLDISSICITDLFNKKEFQDRLASSGYGSRICVHSKKIKDLLIQAGRPAQEVKVTGNPALDQLFSPPEKKTLKKFQENRSLKPHNKLILYARTHSPEEQDLSDKIESFLFKFAARQPNYKVAIRLHPNESKMFNNLPSNVWISTREKDDLKNLLYCADSTLAICSTVLLEANTIGANPIQYLSPREKNRLDFTSIGIAKGVSDLKNLESQLLINKRKNNKVNKNTPAAQKVYELALEMLEL